MNQALNKGIKGSYRFDSRATMFSVMIFCTHRFKNFQNGSLDQLWAGRFKPIKWCFISTSGPKPPGCLQLSMNQLFNIQLGIQPRTRSERTGPALPAADSLAVLTEGDLDTCPLITEGFVYQIKPLTLGGCKPAWVREGVQGCFTAQSSGSSGNALALLFHPCLCVPLYVLNDNEHILDE